MRRVGRSQSGRAARPRPFRAAAIPPDVRKEGRQARRRSRLGPARRPRTAVDPTRLLRPGVRPTLTSAMKAAANIPHSPSNRHVDPMRHKRYTFVADGRRPVWDHSSAASSRPALAEVRRHILDAVSNVRKVLEGRRRPSPLPQADAIVLPVIGRQSGA